MAYPRRVEATNVFGASYGNGRRVTISNNGEVYTCGEQNGSDNFKKSIFLKLTKLSFPQAIKAVDCGNLHTLCLDFEGNVYSFGSNCVGQLGISVNLNNSQGQIHKIDIPVCVQISCGEEFNVCLSEEGYLYSFGNNHNGQLGLGNTSSRRTPQKIDLYETTVEFVQCGGSHVVCKCSGDSVFVWGSNSKKQLGMEHKHAECSPYLFTSWPKDIIDIKCGSSFTILLTASGKVYSCGDNFSGQLGLENNERCYFSPQINSSLKDVEFIECGVSYTFCCDCSSTFEEVKNLPDIVRIECGKYHVMCIDSNNDLYIFGNDVYGQLGLCDIGNTSNPKKHTISNVLDVSKEGHSTFVKTLSNEIYAFGNNDCYQLGIETVNKYQPQPIQVLDNEELWYSNINRCRAKSARF